MEAQTVFLRSVNQPEFITVRYSSEPTRQKCSNVGDTHFPHQANMNSFLLGLNTLRDNKWVALEPGLGMLSLCD